MAESPEREAAIRAEVVRRAGQGVDDEQFDAIDREVRAQFDAESPVQPMAPLQVAIRRAKGGWLSTDTWREVEAFRLAVEAEDEGRRS